jgi:hypothetical protein
VFRAVLAGFAFLAVSGCDLFRDTLKNPMLLILTGYKWSRNHSAAFFGYDRRPF